MIRICAPRYEKSANGIEVILLTTRGGVAGGAAGQALNRYDYRGNNQSRVMPLIIVVMDIGRMPTIRRIGKRRVVKAGIVVRIKAVLTIAARMPL